MIASAALFFATALGHTVAAIAAVLGLYILARSMAAIQAIAGGPLADVSNFPLVDTARARVRARLHDALGGDTTESLVASGAAMTYDEIVEFALRHLEPA